MKKPLSTQTLLLTILSTSAQDSPIATQSSHSESYNIDNLVTIKGGDSLYLACVVE